MSFPVKSPLCFIVGPRDKLQQGVSNNQRQGAAAPADTSKVLYKENSPVMRRLTVKRMGPIHF